jgi:hypothetical protein
MHVMSKIDSELGLGYGTSGLLKIATELTEGGGGGKGGNFGRLKRLYWARTPHNSPLCAVCGSRAVRHLAANLVTCTGFGLRNPR